jgi:PKD repeat protein
MKTTLTIIFTLAAATAFGWNELSHQTMMDYAMAKAAELNPPLYFSGTPYTRMHEGAADEDNPSTRSLDHAYNPMTDGMFPLASMTARDAAYDRWTNMITAFLTGNYDGGDGVGAWHYLGRASHLVEDLTSPLHVFALQHAVPSCQFEAYWQNNDPYLRTLLTGIGSPLACNTLDAKSTEKLDTFSAQRLQYRFNNSCPHKDSDDIRGWSEVVAWTTYFRTTFWGEIVFVNNGSSGVATAPLTTGTTFTDGYVDAQTNTLHAMFPNNVRWVATWYDNYYEITDKNGDAFRWMSWTDVDDFASCGTTDLSAGGWAAGYQDSSKLAVGSSNDGSGARTTGRFFFDLRELGKSTSGTANRYCYPFNYPDGTTMTSHLHQYFGGSLSPLVTRYLAGLLALANRCVTVKTLDSIAADNFNWSRRDNFANGPTFSTGAAGSNFYFVVKSDVTLTAPATDQSGRPFDHWLKDGAPFSGNTIRTLTINTAAAPIPAAGVTYTAAYILVVPPPVAGFAAGPTNGVAPLTVTFTNLSTGATNYAWAFGDGNVSALVNPVNTYTNAGTYSVALTAVGPGGTNQLAMTNYIVVVPPPPVAGFAAGPTNGVAPLTVTFINSSTGATNYAWAFDDGNVSALANPANTYSNGGMYSVTLTAMGAGGTNQLTLTNYIVVTNPMPPILLVEVSYSAVSGFQFIVTNADGTAITSSEQSRIQVYVTTNPVLDLTDWTALTNTTVLTNGVLEIQDPDSLFYQQRYYRSALKP